MGFEGDGGRLFRLLLLLKEKPTISAQKTSLPDTLSGRHFFRTLLGRGCSWNGNGGACQEFELDRY